MAEQDLQTQETTSAEQPQAPSLTLQDLVLVAQIIQIGSQRGTFRAEELADVLLQKHGLTANDITYHSQIIGTV